MSGDTNTGVSPARHGPKSVLVVRLGAMGDVLHAMPAVAAMREAVPGIRIGWVVEERWAPLLCSPVYPRFGPLSPQRPLVDAVHAVNTKRWRKSIFSSKTLQAIREALAGIRAERYEAVLDVQGAMKSALIALASRSEVRVGFAAPRERAAALFYTQTSMATGKHVVEQNVSLVSKFLTEQLAPAPFTLPEDAGAENWCDKEFASRRIEKFAILNPGAGWGAKVWPAERYAQVAQALAVDGVTSLVNIGPGEAKLGERVALLSHGAAHIISCSVSELVSLTRRTSLFVGGDTGPMHLAAALGKPVVALFGPTDPERNGPFGTASVVLRHASSDTSYSHRAQSDAGLMAITADEVIAVARKLLGEQVG